MKRLFLFALLALVCAQGAFAQTPPGAYSSPAQGGGSAFGTPPASPNGVTFTACETPSGGVAGTLGYCWPGITVTSQTGATYTLAAADRSTCIELNNAGMTVTIPDAGGTNFQFGYVGCLLNIGSNVTVNNTSSSQFNLHGVQTGSLRSTFTLPQWNVAYFYISPNNNWDVNVSGTSFAGMVEFTGGPTTTSAPPVTGLLSTSQGWRYCLGNVNAAVGVTCTGYEPQGEYHLINWNGNGWFNISGTVSNNNNAGANPDTASGTALSNGGVAGALYGKEGTCSTFTGVSGGSYLCADSSHEWLGSTNGSSSFGMMVRRQPAPINSTGLTALVANGTTLCAASAGACNVAGQYHVHVNVWGSGTACGTPSPGGVTPNLSWTDENGIAHANVVIPMMSQTGAASTAVNIAAPTVAFQSALANEGGSGDFTLSTNGTVIQYGVAYAACGAGTGTYNIRISVNREQ